ncbi:MAG TPA: protein kinase [Verrucomicrobiae bacterium]
MPAPRVCSRCGVLLGSDTLAGLCPRCMLLSVLGPEPNLPLPSEEEAVETRALPTPAALSRFGDYELLEEVAYGGMGVIYKARQVKLDRTVAIKMLLLGQRASDEVVERFKREAQSAARLRHPNIVAIHEVGEVEGQPFFSMDYVQGRDLARIVRERSLPSRQAATYVRAVAAAVHYAHQQGIIHRDLKPSNILIDLATDEVRITDFGLAKRVGEQSDLTLTGQVMGSPNHMAPELAAGQHHRAGPASDIFSLGTILYEMLTGRPPFLADSLQTTLLKIRDEDPVPPRTLDAGIPRDLETLCLKCLEKDPAKRFASAQELADELERYLRGEPIRTRPAGIAEKTWRWCRRKPALAGLAAAIVVLAVVSTVAAIELGLARQRQEREQYYANIGLAKQHIEVGNIDLALELLLRCPARYRHWEWGHLLYLCHQDIRTIPAHTNVLSLENARFNMYGDSLTKIEFSTDSRSLVTVGGDGTAKVWDVADGRELFACGGFSNRVEVVSFSPDATRLATVEGTNAKTRDARSGDVLLEFRGLSGAAVNLAWAPDGQRLAVAMHDGRVQVRDPVDGGVVVEIPGASGPLAGLFFTPDGQRLVRSEPLRCVAFDPASGRELDSFALRPEEGVEMVPDPFMIRFVSRTRPGLVTLHEKDGSSRPLERLGWDKIALFSPDGRRFVIGGDQDTPTVWEATKRRPLFTIPDSVCAADFSPDGKRLVTAGNKSVAHVWDIDTQQEVRALRGHERIVQLVVFSPDGRLVATGDRDGIVKLWSATGGREYIVPGGFPNGTSISRDGERFTIGPVLGGMKVYDSRSGRQLLQINIDSDNMNAACFSPDGARLVTSSELRQPRVWEVETGQCLFTLEGHTRAVLNGVGYSPDGRRIATGSFDKTARLWDAQTGRPLQVLAGHSNWVEIVHFSPNSRLLATCGQGDSRLLLWDVGSGRCLRRIAAHQGSCLFTRFCPDGTQVASAGVDNTIRFWDVESGSLRKELRLRGCGFVFRLSPDGKRLFAWTAKHGWAGTDIPAFEIWDVETGRQIVTLSGHQRIGLNVDISADGKQVLTSASFDIVRQWQVFPWQEADYPGPRRIPFAERVRHYAERYWSERLAAEATVLTNPTPVRVVEIPFDRARIPPRDPRASPRLLDLTRYYTAPLDWPSIQSLAYEADDDFRNLPAGVGKYGGMDFDVRGVIHLRPARMMTERLPVRVDGLLVGQKVQRLHLLHGTAYRERDGIVVAALVWNFADGTRHESEIVYGRHVRSRWVGHDPVNVTPGGRVAWEGTNPAATDYRDIFPGGEPGKEVRLYLSSWENPRPEVAVTSLDLVSRLTDSAPFFLGITVE